MPHVKRPSPLSIRLSAEERTALEQRAGSRPIGAYVKGIVFGTTSRPAGKRRTRDAALLAQLLAVLGSSRIAPNLSELFRMANSGSLDLDEATCERLAQACDDVRLMHNVLMRALGKHERAQSVHQRRAASEFNAHAGGGS